MTAVTRHLSQTLTRLLVFGEEEAPAAAEALIWPLQTDYAPLFLEEKHRMCDNFTCIFLDATNLQPVVSRLLQETQKHC